MYFITKRLFDIFFSLIAIIVLTPLLLPIILMLRFTSEGEIFYIQKRIGLNNKPFGIIKFATMLKNSSKMDGGYITVKNDPRLTFMGVFKKIKNQRITAINKCFSRSNERDWPQARYATKFYFLSC